MPDTDFDRALAFVFRGEGGRANHPADKGKKTSRGVTQKNYDSWRGKHGLPTRDVWEITEEEARAFYREEFWWVAKALPWPLSLVVFDTAVLFGQPRARKWLLEARASGADLQATMRSILERRAERHREVAEKDPTQRVFLRGWLNRVDALADAAGLIPGRAGEAAASKS